MKLTDIVAVLPKVDHAEAIPFLLGLSKAAEAKKDPAAKGLDLSAILTLIAQYGPTILALLALIKDAAGPRTGPAGELPKPDPAEVPPSNDEEEDGPAKPVPPAGRTIAGIDNARWFHFGEGDPGKVKEMDHARFKSILSGADPLNGDLKSRLVADITPRLSDGSKLLKGMPENARIRALFKVEFDGQSYEGDDIANSPVTLNNLDANFKMTPRFVMGPGIAGAHTFAAFVKVFDQDAYSPASWTQIGETLRIN